MSKLSGDYHDYVFKDGKYIGKFEEMYENSSEVPWHQDETCRSIFSNIDIEILKQFEYDSVCEVGCGLGYFTNRLHLELNSHSGSLQVTGVDISKTAVEKASGMFPDIRFVQGDLLVDDPLPGEKFDLVVIKEVFWYICDNLDRFLNSVLKLIDNGGFLYVSQSFPASDTWVGKDVIDSPQSLLKILSEKVAPEFHSIEWDQKYGGRPLLHFLGRLKSEDK